MPDYKAMYLEMTREVEKAIQILINVQRKCEEMYINVPDPELIQIIDETRGDK